MVGRSLKTCREKLDALIEHGLTRLEISTSAYHRQFVDSAAVNNIILAGRPIELALHVRFSTSCGVEMNPAPFEGLDEVELIRAPVMPVGRAATAIPADEFSFSEPSGAGVFMVGDYYLKTARGEAGIKLKAQAEWLSYVRSQGVSCVPKVVALHTDDTGLVSYLMRGYRINSPGADYGPTEMASEVLGRLETVWEVPAPTPTPPDWPGYIGRVGSLLARYDERAAGLLTETGQRVYELNRARVKGYTVHGDPTFENVVYDEDAELILLDPNPQTPPHVCLPELDAAKVLQSAFGWESFVYRRSAELRVDTSLRPLIQSRFGPDGWPTCLWLLATHLVRTLPYGAKVDDGTRLLPSIRGVLDHLSGLMGSG